MNVPRPFADAATAVTPAPPTVGLLFVVEYTIPRCVIDSPPVTVTVPPNVAELMPMLVLVGLVTVGGVAAEGVKSNPLR